MMNDLIFTWARALGWAVVHSLWQIALVFVLYQALRFVFRKNESRLYLLALASMAVVFFWFAATLYAEVSQVSPSPQTLSVEQVDVEGPADALPSPPAAEHRTASGTFLPGLISFLEKNTPKIGLVWLALFLFFALRLWGGYLRLQHALHRQSKPAPHNWQARCDTLGKSLGIHKAVRLLESGLVSEPVAVGMLKPVILVPAGLLFQLPPDQVEALLLHELAHIRRADYLVNILQLTLEAVFFYHPLFGCISRDARRRREHCCDDVVLRHGTHPLTYAHTLLALKAQLNTFTKHQIIMQSTGKSGFAARIRRIVEPQSHRAARPVLLLPFAFVLAGALALYAAPEVPSDTATELVPYTLVVPERRTDVERRLPEASTAQPRIENKQTAPDSLPPVQTEVAMELPKMNIMYIGVDNPLNLAVQGKPCEALEARLVGAGSLKHLGGCQYAAVVTQPGTVDIEVWDKQGKRIAVKTFRVKRIPDPTPTANYYRNQKVTREELENFTTIKALLLNFDFDAECSVVSYELTLMNPAEDPVMRINKGADLDQGCLALLKSAKPGAKIFFDNVKCQCPGDAAPRHLGGVSYKLAE